ncbi:MAG: hypothetical protein JWL69_4842 [Phycisphaerales bacterium]|nr:hypothetical protein [Phycisphaerales bacterium]
MVRPAPASAPSPNLSLSLALTLLPTLTLHLNLSPPPMPLRPASRGGVRARLRIKIMIVHFRPCTTTHHFAPFLRSSPVCRPKRPCRDPCACPACIPAGQFPTLCMFEKVGKSEKKWEIAGRTASREFLVSHGVAGSYQLYGSKAMFKQYSNNFPIIFPQLGPPSEPLRSAPG